MEMSVTPGTCLSVSEDATQVSDGLALQTRIACACIADLENRAARIKLGQAF
jgi:hypothetical protein